MTEFALLCGAPGSSLLAFAEELDRTARTRAFVPWNLGAALERLREATLHRALVWRGPIGGELAWVDRAISVFAPALIEALFEQELAVRGELDVFALGHPDLARHQRLVARALPEARWFLCASDGRRAPFGRVPAAGSDRDLALAGLAWAEAWSAALMPLWSEREVLGARLCFVRDEEFAADPSDAKARFFAWLGCEPRSAWQGARPWLGETLSGPALDGFACSGAGARLQRALGYETVEPGARALDLPELAAALVRGFVYEHDFDRARAVLTRARRFGAHALVHCAEAELWEREGDAERARRGWWEALELDPTLPEPWERLLAEPLAQDTPALAARARRSSVPRVRQALARWLVARGLDVEAAEIVAAVEHTSWAKQP